MSTGAVAAEDTKGGDRDGKKRTMGRRKQCKFCGDEALKIDYKDVNLLRRYVSERGKIMPNRITLVCHATT